MNPLLDLRRILAAQAPRISGQVLERLDGNRYRISVPRGTVEAVATGNAAFVVGDEVMLREGVILGRVKPAASVRVYSV